ncbi:MAG TPA: lactate utilization protein [Ruminiclostridium sp.]|nr:lactate utilization protein [Ruminiclostridium sp.]
MDKNAKAIWEKRIQKTMENLVKNNMQPHYVESVKDVAGKVAELLKEGDTVAVGGSMSLSETGVIDLLRSGKYTFLDRYEEGLSNEQIREVFLKSFFADVYLSSSNAITENGELYNVDGNSNRVAAICYGPKSVIIVAGVNKIVKDLDDAVKRVKTIAAPANCTRLECKTYCKEKGECMGLASGRSGMTSGCSGPNRICCSYVVSAYQNQKDRIKVIIVGEELGY